MLVSHLMVSLTSIFRVTTLCAFASVAMAAPTTWFLNGVTFADGGTASGSFVYDASTNTYSAVSISTTPGTTFGSGTTYTGLNPGFPSSSTLLVAVPNPALGDFTGTRVLALNFVTPLANGGGTSSLNAIESVCANSGCTTPTTPNRFSTAGNATTTSTTSVPALSNAGLAVLAMLLLGSSVYSLRRKAVQE
jgi:hypothetical protein